jgi:hypothetical protein
MFAVIEWTPILAALTAGLLALLGTIWQSRKTRSLNTDEHAQNSAKLERIETKIDATGDRLDRVSDRLDDHIEEHRYPTTRRRWR